MVKCELFNRTILANMAIVLKRFIDFDGNHAINGESAFGVSLNNQDSGLAVGCCVIGEALIEAGEAIAIGAKITPGADGKAKNAGVGDSVCGYALEAAAGLGSIFRAMVIPAASTGANEIRTIKSAEILYNSASPLTIWTVPAGAVITKVMVEVTETWDGAAPAPTLDIGDAVDPDGYVPTASLTLGAAALYALSDNDLGALIWDNANDARIYDHFAVAGAVIATITPGGAATQGKAVAYIEYFILPS